jgi:hypothetical protein
MIGTCEQTDLELVGSSIGKFLNILSIGSLHYTI